MLFISSVRAPNLKGSALLLNQGLPMSGMSAGRLASRNVAAPSAPIGPPAPPAPSASSVGLDCGDGVATAFIVGEGEGLADAVETGAAVLTPRMGPPPEAMPSMVHATLSRPA